MQTEQMRCDRSCSTPARKPRRVFYFALAILFGRVASSKSPTDKAVNRAASIQETNAALAPAQETSHGPQQSFHRQCAERARGADRGRAELQGRARLHAAAPAGPTAPACRSGHPG